MYRSAFLKKLHSVPNLQTVIPFVRATYSDPTNYVWEDEVGVLHRIVHSEGSEQRDPLMPLLFSVAIHDPLEEASRDLIPEYLSSDVPDRTRTEDDSLGEKLFAHRQDPSMESCIHVSCGKG